ncbi:MAG: proline--tRNA ligase [Patescibacteria group bacterium]
MAKQNLTPKSENMSEWYTQAIQQAELADYSPVKGCMVMRPRGYAIWENIHAVFDPMLKKLGVENAYFPLFVPMSLLDREAKHVEGFAPELAVVTHGGGSELEDKLVVRPTSETIMYEMYSKWVHSHRDLPLCLNQWNNVVRWEKRTYFFLRTTEFLWQEAHTAHATHEEALNMVLSGLAAYRHLVEDYLAIPVVMGRKSESERFPGADMTTTIEAIMPNGKALQSGTSHDLGQNFSQPSAFNISFQNESGQTDYAWQTSYGLSTRIIGALIMTHGDDDGLVFPPKIAPTQIKIVAANNDEEVLSACQQLFSQLKSSFRVEFKNDQSKQLGWKLNEAEIQGAPVILVVGKRELANGEVGLMVRHSKEKLSLQLGKVVEQMAEILDRVQLEMFTKAKATQQSLVTEVNSYDEFRKVMEEKRGFIKAHWCEQAECEAQIKEETKASTRCLPFIDNQGQVEESDGKCVKCGAPSKHRWLFALAY